MDLPAAIATAAAKTGAIAANVGPEHMAAPTPCADFDVVALAAHMSLAPLSIAAARRTEYVPEDFDPGSWPHRFLADLADLPAAWAQPGALEGTVVFGRGEMPALQAASITLMELLLHGWDLARATGQAYAVDEELGEMVYRIVEAGRPAGTERGFFGPPIDTPDGSSRFEQALALSGRDPAWTG